MACSYTPGSTAVSDRVRLNIGDTDENQALFDDAELDDIIVQETSENASTARCAEILALRFARQYDFMADGSSFFRAQKSKMYRALGKEFRAKSDGSVVIQPVRQDGYSDDIASNEVNITRRRDRRFI